jgi:hypothetical protein
VLRGLATLAALLAGAALTGCYAETLPATNVTATSAVLQARGHTDSVSATVYSDSVRVLLGDGDATFRTPNDFPGAAMAVEDFNRDGKPDVLVLDDETGTLAQVLLNTTP